MVEISASILLERILHDALERKSTDIHLQVANHNLQVEFRIGGRLFPYVSVPGHGESISRRVKALCKMDVNESRLPQDGSFRYESEAYVSDVRVASLPTISGESVVLRLLPLKPADVSFASLGMLPDDTTKLLRLLKSDHGLVLVAGPTGAGKTTTMYAMMTQLARWGRRVLSIEDPVEARLRECQQMEVREQYGLSFDGGLKALLRQDPDVIMVGEIRDDITAHVVFRAAVSGHLVLSTTHATDLVGVASRLVDFGLSRSLMTDVLRGVIIQHRIASPCHDCLGHGCVTCNGTGEAAEYHPRFGVYEFSPEIVGILASDASWTEIRNQLVEQHKYTDLRFAMRADT